MAFQITSLTIVYSIVYSGADQRNIKAPRHWPLCGNSPVTGVSSIWWRHHGLNICWSGFLTTYGFTGQTVCKSTVQHNIEWTKHLMWMPRKLLYIQNDKYSMQSTIVKYILAFSFMMTSSNGNFFRVTSLCAGNSPVCAWINDWVNNREAVDLRRHRAHYDVTVMTPYLCRHSVRLPRSVEHTSRKVQRIW